MQLVLLPYFKINLRKPKTMHLNLFPAATINSLMEFIVSSISKKSPNISIANCLVLMPENSNQTTVLR